MPLNEKQIRILQVIDRGSTTGDSIAQALGSSMQMLRYYLDTLVEDGYLKAAKVYDNSTKEFQIVRAYLTEKGKAELEQTEPTQAPSIEAAQPTAKLEANSSKTVENLGEILKSLESLHTFVDQLPQARRELATVYFDDLQDEIRIVYRRKPEKIKAYLIAVLGVILPVLKQMNNSSNFLEIAKYLSEKLNVSIKLPGQTEL